jgi:tRNA-specific 2-thiouridylase
MIVKEVPTMNRKAVALLSGGLDSSVALKLILMQDIEVTAINFKSPFCNCNRKNSCGNEAARVSRELGIPVKLIYVDSEYIEMVRNPKFGYGSQMNPCLDCRIFMHKKSAEFMEEIGATFMITGEVLGQRPMSQRRDAMNLIDRETGLKGRILRPLSAGVMDPTFPEEQGIVDRNRLLSITGRGRKTQIKLAEKLSIKDYPCPAGGCLLTDANFAAKLKDLFRHQETFKMEEVRFLRIGRHFRLTDNLKIVVGRNEEENNRIESLAKEKYPFFVPEDFMGPACIALGKLDKSSIETIPQILLRYARTGGNKTVRLQMHGEEELLSVSNAITDQDLDKFRISD